MKKLMFAAAAIAAGVAVADVTSANIVGYSATPEVQANKFYIGNAPFEGVGSEDTVTIDKLCTTDAQPGVYDTMESQAPFIEVLKEDGVDYDFYYYISDAYDAEGNEVTGWADGNGDLAEDQLALGTAFWFKAVGGAASLTMPGQVSKRTTVTKSLNANKFALIGNPFPMSLDLTKVTGTFPAGVYDTMESKAPFIEVLKEDGIDYDFYYWISDAYDADGNEATGWADGNGDLVYDPVAGVSQGFWIRLRETAGDITFAF